VKEIVFREVEMKGLAKHPIVLGYKSYEIGKCCTPTLAKCAGEAQHLEKLGVEVLRDSRMFRAR
jgi:hypothetical protein